MRHERGSIRAGGHQLETLWLRGASATAPTLVFLHEGLGCVEAWRDFPERLSGALGTNAFLYSRAGYGGSDACVLPRPLDYLEHEGRVVLPEVLAAAEINECILFGHSDGGSIALVYAGTHATSSLLGVVTEAAHVFNEDVCVQSADAVRERFLSGELRERLARYHGDNVDCAFWGWNEAWLDPGFLTMNLEAYLPAIHAPLLALQGVEDEYGTEAQIRAIVAGTGGGAESEMLSPCGHAPHRDAPDRVIERVSTFLREKLARSA